QRNMVLDVRKIWNLVFGFEGTAFTGKKPLEKCEAFFESWTKSRLDCSPKVNQFSSIAQW
ncbi:MAG: hypothetical protein K2N15_03410, partial [Lachnospiraceae bacterium]|nr:hypothetical protein [Lachnospiraceae bacterium]